jgi:sugar O-acyltransferase (sialic acid O-acetyltransferase NeuD family)
VSDGRSLAVIGAGGHAKVVASTALAVGWQISGVYDDNEGLWGGKLLGVPIKGPAAKAVVDQVPAAVIGIGSNDRRAILSKQLHLPWATVVHPSAFLDPSVVLGDGTVVFAGVVVQPSTVIGDHVILNTGSTIDHDCRVGSYAHIAPGVNLAGNVTVGSESFLGIGVAVIPGTTIGAQVVVGAGAVVIHDLPDRVVAVGVPARVVRSCR